MDTNHFQSCPSCGTPLDQSPDNLSSGLCPRCLLAESLQTTQGAPQTSPPPPLEEIAAAFPDLEVLELIGKGGMGAVYKARQKSLDRFVALKLLPQSLAADPEFSQRFQAEAKALATLNHPNIVTVHDFGKQNDFYFLLMEFVDGPNLRHLLRDQKLTAKEALAIVPPLCEALEFAHQQNIVHRDIKPENLLLDTKGRVKVVDFGISKILGQNDPETKISGTPAYMAPEQKDNPHTLDTRADIYSLGVVLYEMLTGERPTSDLTPPSGKNASLDVRLDEVVLRALDSNPEQRWQSATALNTQLQTILTDSNPAPQEIKKPKTKWLKILAASLLTLAIIIQLTKSDPHLEKKNTPPPNTTSPNLAEEESQLLEAYQSKFSLQRGHLGLNHPDVRAIEARISIYQNKIKEHGDTIFTNTMHRVLDRMKTRLLANSAVLKQQGLGKKHPDVKAITQQIEQITSLLKEYPKPAQNR